MSDILITYNGKTYKCTDPEMTISDIEKALENSVNPWHKSINEDMYTPTDFGVCVYSLNDTDEDLIEDLECGAALVGSNEYASQLYDVESALRRIWRAANYDENAFVPKYDITGDYTIGYISGIITTIVTGYTKHAPNLMPAFKNQEACEQFINNWRDDLETIFNFNFKPTSKYPLIEVKEDGIPKIIQKREATGEKPAVTNGFCKECAWCYWVSGESTYICNKKHCLVSKDGSCPSFQYNY